MKPYPPLVVVVALVLTACSKSDPAQTAAPDPGPRRNWSESLGFAPDADGYAQNPSPPAAMEKKPASTSPITRTLTGKDGRTVDAVLLSRTETTVKIRRTSDRMEFTIPLDKLSEADRSFIKQSGVPLTTGR